MCHSSDCFGVIAEKDNARISVFDTDTLEVLRQIPLRAGSTPADVTDVALTSDCTRAVVTSVWRATIFQIDLCKGQAEAIVSTDVPQILYDVDITPDDRFAVCVDGVTATPRSGIISYSLKKNAVVSSVPTDAQAVAVSPSRNGLVLTAVMNANSVRRFMIDHEGILTDCKQEFPAGTKPVNISFSPDGRFAFVANRSASVSFGGVSVLSTLFPDNISLLDTVPVPGAVQSLAVSGNGRHIFALGIANVDIFSFDPVSGSLRLARSFAHGLSIAINIGIDQIALDPTESRLFISATDRLAAFTTYGIPLGSVEGGVSGLGGLSVCRSS
ncbi:MAG TPA: hypothetical protein PKW29_01945 [Clostridia bacterium]|nr:hypothetical protein [Clostridia bacterium]